MHADRRHPGRESPGPSAPAADDAARAADDAAPAGARGRHRSAEERLRAARGTATPPALPHDAAGQTPDTPSREGDDCSVASRTGEESTHGEAAASASGGLELVAVQAEGGGTRTWRARERSTREPFTVTFATGPDPALRQRQEQRFAALVAAFAESPHPHLVPVLATLGEGEQVRALVSACVTAETLHERARGAERISPEEMSSVLGDVARALGHLHDRGWAHGRLGAEHVLLTGDGAVVDGYGVPFGSSLRVLWGHSRQTPDTAGPVEEERAPGVDGHHGPRDEWAVPDAGVPPWTEDHPGQEPASAAGAAAGTEQWDDDAAHEGASAAQDVYDLGVLGWLALTGRLPGTDSHRVPLTLMCPTAPRHLVLMLEAALADDPAARPAAHELATGFSAPAPRTRPARRPPERMTPEVIRADGTVVKLRARALPRAVARLRPASGRGEAATAPVGGRERTVESAGAAAPPGGRETVLGAVGAAVRRPGVRGPALLLAVLLAVALAWALVQHDGSTGTGADTGVAASPPAPAAPSTDPSRAAADRQTPATGSTSPGAGHGASPSPGTPTHGSASAPGASMQDKDREAADAVRALVAERAAALAAGDEAAAAAVYVPDSGLAARDREVIRRAAAQDSTGSGFTALSGLSMEVASLEEQPPAPGAHLSPAEAARSRTYRAEVLTRGWHRELPAGSAVTREGGDARQSVRITVVQTSQGWRLTDVTPLPRK